MRMPYIVVCGLPGYNIFPNYLTNGTNFELKMLLQKNVFWFSLQLSSKIYLILRRIRGDMIQSVHWSSYKVHVVLLRVYWNLHFRDKFSTNTQISNFMEIRAVGAEFHADRRMDGLTDMKK
jgi:hypothetical protein